MPRKKELYEYENEPFYYCKHCHSLHIRIDDDYTNYCADCGSTDIAKSTNMKKWVKDHYKQYKIQYYE